MPISQNKQNKKPALEILKVTIKVERESDGQFVIAQTDVPAALYLNPSGAVKSHEVDRIGYKYISLVQECTELPY